MSTVTRSVGILFQTSAALTKRF